MAIRAQDIQDIEKVEIVFKEAVWDTTRRN